MGKYFGAEEKLTKNEMIMYRAMTEIINNKELRDKYKKNAHLCVEQYEPQSIIKQWIDLIEEQNIENRSNDRLDCDSVFL